VGGVPRGKALDLAQAGRSPAPIRKSRAAMIMRSSRARRVIVTRRPRQPGMSRDDLLTVNLNVIAKVGAASSNMRRTRSSFASPTRSM